MPENTPKTHHAAPAPPPASLNPKAAHKGPGAGLSPVIPVAPAPVVEPVKPAEPAAEPSPDDVFVMKTNSLDFVTGQKVTREQLGGFVDDWIKRKIIERA